MSTVKAKDELYMRQALALAARGAGVTSPNPMVGAVVVRGSKVVGSGWHRRAGGPHAEVYALKQAGTLAKNAILYVTLEPCAHEGRTPPCAPLVAASGVRRVVTAMQDPNPKVAGRGFEILKKAGIEIASRVLEHEAEKLNEFYIKFITTKKPFVIMKGAMTLDGKIATAGGESKWITGEAARMDAHKLRRAVDAVLVGIETMLADNPALNCRLPGKPPQPLRIVLDSRLRSKYSMQFCKNASDGRSIIATLPGSDPEKAARLEEFGCRVLRVQASKDGRISIPALLRALGRMDVTSLLVEGGGAVHDAFLRAGCVDKVVLYVAPKILGGFTSHTLVDGIGFPSLAKALLLKDVQTTTLGRDIKIEAYPVK